jgi:hypothetical protein
MAVRPGLTGSLLLAQARSWGVSFCSVNLGRRLRVCVYESEREQPER